MVQSRLSSPRAAEASELYKAETRLSKLPLSPPTVPTRFLSHSLSVFSNISWLKRSTPRRDKGEAGRRMLSSKSSARVFHRIPLSTRYTPQRKLLESAGYLILARKGSRQPSFLLLPQISSTSAPDKVGRTGLLLQGILFRTC